MMCENDGEGEGEEERKVGVRRSRAADPVENHGVDQSRNNSRWRMHAQWEGAHTCHLAASGTPSSGSPISSHAMVSSSVELSTSSFSSSAHAAGTCRKMARLWG